MDSPADPSGKSPAEYAYGTTLLLISDAVSQCAEQTWIEVAGIKTGRTVIVRPV